MEQSAVSEAVPVTVICGFLGAGKTTLLKRVLESPRGIRFGVLVNDFGAINIDAALIVETGADQVSLANGCICCSIQDDLVEAIDRILRLEPRPDRLIIEASGVSRPLSILEVLDRPAFAGRLAVDATVCLVDADQFTGLDFASTELAIDQAGSSDLLVLNKCDIAAAADIASTEDTLTGPMPNVRRIRTAFADVPFEVLFGFVPPGGGPSSRPSPEHRHGHDHDHVHHHHDHTDQFESWSWSSDRPLDLETFHAVMRRLPPSLLRAKGILQVRADGRFRRATYHLVGKRSAIALDDGAPPTVSQLVAIAGRGMLDGDAMRLLLDSCRVH